MFGVYKGWYSNIFCALIFVLGQDEGQGSITENEDGQKSNFVLSGQRLTSHFSKTTIRIIRTIQIQYIHIQIIRSVHYYPSGLCSQLQNLVLTSKAQLGRRYLASTS